MGNISTGVCNHSEMGQHKTEPTVKLEIFTVGNDTAQEQEMDSNFGSIICVESSRVVSTIGERRDKLNSTN